MTHDERFERDNAVKWGHDYSPPSPPTEPAGERFKLPGGTILNKRNIAAGLRAEPGRAVKE